MNYDTKAFKHATTKRGYDSVRTVIGEAPSKSKNVNSKDTKKWCKGVVGREHTAVHVYTELLWSHRSPDQSVIEPPMELQSLFESKRYQYNRYGQYAIPSVTLYCTTCKKHIKYMRENCFELRKRGIVILTKLPDAQ